MPALRAELTHFILIDKQPLHDDGMTPRTEEQLLLELVACAAGAAGYGFPERRGDHWSCPLRGGGTLLYFFNVRDAEVATHPTLAAWLPDVRTLYVAGFNPCVELVRALPSLKRAWSTYMCRAPGGEEADWFRTLPAAAQWAEATAPAWAPSS